MKAWIRFSKIFKFGEKRKEQEALFKVFLNQQKRTLDLIATFIGEIRDFKESVKEIHTRNSSDLVEIGNNLDQLIETFGSNAKALTQYFRIETKIAEEKVKESKLEPTEHDLTF